MTTQNDKRIDKRISTMLSLVNKGTIEPDKQLLDTLRERSALEFVANSARSGKKLGKTISFSKWGTIMKNRITKLAVAAVIIAAVVLSFTILDISAYALEQTIKAYEGLRYVHIKDFREGKSEPLQFWVELDIQGQVKRVRAYYPAWFKPAEGPFVGVWSEGKMQVRHKNGFISTEREDSLSLDMSKLIKECDPRSVVKEVQQLELHQREAEGKIDITTSEPASKSDPIVITVKFPLQNDDVSQIVLFVDQNTKLVTRIIINGSGDGYQHSLEFSDYNVPLDERVFMLEPTPEITKTFMKNINANIALLDINKSTVADVISVLGEPWAYRFRGEEFLKDNLPEAYSMRYPGGFFVSIYKNKVTQWGCQQTPGNEILGYVFFDLIQIGTTFNNVLDKLGSPEKVVEGFGGKGKIMYEDNTGYANMNINERKGFCFSRYDNNGKEIKVYFDDNVLYKDLSGIKGFCFYGTVSKGRRIRFSFMDNKVVAMYEYRTEPVGEIE
jgi:hypothetical protein